MKTTSIILAALAAATTFAAAQGSLTPPPGVPGPVMKTLDQVEARTPIPATVTPGAGPHFTITQPGSYYLTGNITVTTDDGIRITAASDVSIDLNGFTIRSTLTGSANGSAIRGFNSIQRLNVSNGNLKSGSTPPTNQGFLYGIACTNGSLTEATITNVGIDGMALNGIFVHSRSLVESCIVTNNGSHGIFLDNATVRNCLASSNGGAGIVADSSSVYGSTASNNVGSGMISSSGTVSNSVARSNGSHGILVPSGTVTNCTANSNGDDGIQAVGGIVNQCRSTGNADNGIKVGVGVVSHSVATDNDSDFVPTDFQIQVSTGGQRISCVPATEAGSP